MHSKDPFLVLSFVFAGDIQELQGLLSTSRIPFGGTLQPIAGVTFGGSTVCTNTTRFDRRTLRLETLLTNVENGCSGDTSITPRATSGLWRLRLIGAIVRRPYGRV